MFWSIQWGEYGSNYIVGLKIDSDNNLLLGGHSGVDSSQDVDTFALKVNGINGEKLWEERIGMSGSPDWALSTTIDADGNFFIVGNTKSSLYSQSKGSNDFFAAKILNSNGTILWGYQSGSALEDSANSVTTDISGNPIICGSSRIISIGQSGICTKLDPDGSFLWTLEIPTEGNKTSYVHEAILAVTLIPSSNDIIVGGYSGVVWTLARISPETGDVHWRISGGTVQVGALNAVCIGKDGHVYAVGYVAGDGYALSSARQVDAYACKVDVDTGKVMWTWKRGNVANDFANGLTVSSNGDVYVCGSISITNGKKTSVKAFVAELNSTSGRENWIEIFGSKDGEVAATSIAFDTNSGDLFLAGTTMGSLFALSKSKQDGWVARTPVPPNGSFANAILQADSEKNNQSVYMYMPFVFVLLIISTVIYLGLCYARYNKRQLRHKINLSPLVKEGNESSDIELAELLRFRR